MLIEAKQLNLIKALGEETRLRILKLLSKKELCVCELEAALKLPQSRVSRHLSILKSAGLVSDRREGIWIFYSLFKPQNLFEKGIVELIRQSLKDSKIALEDERRLKKKLSQIYAYKCK